MIKSAPGYGWQTGEFGSHLAKVHPIDDGAQRHSLEPAGNVQDPKARLRPRRGPHMSSRYLPPELRRGFERVHEAASLSGFPSWGGRIVPNTPAEVGSVNGDRAERGKP